MGANRDAAVMGSWAGGLAAWRSGDFEFAGALFRDLAGTTKPFRLCAAPSTWAHRIEMRPDGQKRRRAICRSPRVISTAFTA